MFSNNIKSFIIINIYSLIIVDIILLLAIYFIIIKDKVKTKRYEKALRNLKPKVLAYIKNDYMLSKINKELKRNFNKTVAIDIMADYSEKNDLDISEKIMMLRLDVFLIRRIHKKPNLSDVKKLAFMRTETSYYTLLKMTSSEDLEIRYTSFWGLALINATPYKRNKIIKKLINSNILIDRIVEIIDRFNISISECLQLLEQEESIQGKVIFIKNIIPREEIKEEENSDKLLKFLEDEKEVKIAAILALCNSKNEKYIDELIRIYENEINWEVRVSIAKGFSNFKNDKVKEILLKMTKDEEWWVRFNAVKSIVAMGEEGVFTLIDLSLESDDKKISDLAYYFLNSDKDIYNTVNKMAKKIEV